MNTKRLIKYGLIAGAVYLIWKNRTSVMPGAVAVSAGAPSTAVSPTAAATTANMTALATSPNALDYVMPGANAAAGVNGLRGGYGTVGRDGLLNGVRMPRTHVVRYPSASPYMRDN